MKETLKRLFSQLPIRPFWDGPTGTSSIAKVKGIRFHKTREATVTKSGNKSNEHGVWMIKNGRVLGNTAAVVSDNKLLKELSYEFTDQTQKHSIFSQIVLGKRFRLEGNALLLADQFSATGNLMHWSIDWLPRLAIIREKYPNFDGVDWIVTHRPTTKYNKYLFDQLALPIDKIVWADFKTNIDAETLIVPSPIHLQGDPPKWAVDYVKDTLSPNQTSPEKDPSRIYISRERARSRRVQPTAEFEVLIEKYGFQKIILEDLDPIQQIQLFQSTEAIIAPHGAGLTHLIHCRRGTKVLELFSSAYAYICYANIAKTLDLDYRHIVVDSKVQTTVPFEPFSTNNGHPELSKLMSDNIELTETRDWDSLNEFLETL